MDDRTPLDDLAWETIAKLSHRMTASKTRVEAFELAREHGLIGADGGLGPDQQKTVRLTDGTERRVQVIGLLHDDLPDGNKAGITLMFLDPIARTNLSLDPEAAILALLPHELTSLIKAVDKRMFLWLHGGEGVMTETTSLLWALALTELIPRMSIDDLSHGTVHEDGRYNAEGRRYFYFAQHDVGLGKENARLVLRWHDDPVTWWLRSTSPQGTGARCCVSTEGRPGLVVDGASKAWAAPAFCI
jgi:hypothetical protein